jgi:uncharacterized membrane protein YoaK (UPF0700 family)
MLIHVGEGRTARVDLGLAVTLSAIAGAINAAGLHAAGFFSANMTGNLSLLSDSVALGGWPLAALLAVVVGAFVAGAFASTLLIETGRNRGIDAIYAYSILAEALLLAALGVADLALDSVHSGPTLIVGLSFLMGLQNATGTLISNARVRTTHVSGMATDIGIELAGLLRTGPADGRERYVNLLILHASTLVAFFGAGILGVLAYSRFGSATLLAIALVLAALAAPFLGRRKPTV